VAHVLTQVTFVIFGCATYTPPPPPPV